MGQVAIYCRVSTDDQLCARQERDLRAFAKRADHHVLGVFKETTSGAKNDRVERKWVMAQAREIDAILVTELSRWGRSAQDLAQTLDDLLICPASEFQVTRSPTLNCFAMTQVFQHQ